jgi:hypothetical protein
MLCCCSFGGDDGDDLTEFGKVSAGCVLDLALLDWTLYPKGIEIVLFLTKSCSFLLLL